MDLGFFRNLGHADITGQLISACHGRHHFVELETEIFRNLIWIDWSEFGAGNASKPDFQATCNRFAIWGEDPCHPTLKETEA